MQLSDRLKKVADFVTPGMRLADIGTDHGYVPIELVMSGKIPSAIAMDVNKGPLERAREHIVSFGLQDRITIRLSDGLDKLALGEADSILIAGMGGNLTVKILNDGKSVADSAKELILSPHTEVFLVREYLIKNSYNIFREEMVFDAGKFYTVIKAVKTDDKSVIEQYNMEKFNYIYGKLLIESKSEVFIQFMESERKKTVEVLENLNNCHNLGPAMALKMSEIKEKLAFFDKMLR